MGPNLLQQFSVSSCQNSSAISESLRQALPCILEEAQSRYPEHLLPWREFMRLALYHPQWGYYASRIAGVGRAGDFTTVPVLDMGLARAVLAWAAKMRQQFAALRQAPLLEVGAGEGHLAATLLALRPWREFLQPYGIVEVSAPLRHKQQQRLRWRPVRWFDSVEEALDFFDGRALIFSNELVDAFPCSSWCLTADGWREVGVRWAEGRLWEGLREAVLPDASIFLQPIEEFPLGQRVETHESWREWLQSWTPRVQAAAMLTIDYGGPVKGLYHRRPQGSLRAYWKQQRFVGNALWSRFGQQDITADVNFMDLMQWGTQFGWTTQSLLPLHEFCGSEMGEKIPGKILGAESAGGAFWVLQQILTG